MAAVDQLGISDTLRRSVRGEVSDASTRRAEYSSDASNYRVRPAVLVYPADADDLEAVVRVAREAGVPLTVRGAGTSVAGNAVGVGIVADLSVHMNRVFGIDPAARTARVQPGVILSALQKEAAVYGLRLGPDPSTQDRATIGGMIGNNACGPHAVAYGKMSDNVAELLVVDGQGRRFTARDDLSAVPGLQSFVNDHLALIRTEFGRFGRQVSGYSLEHLLPERGHNLAKTLVGTEGTAVTVLEATLSLVPVSPSPAVVVLGYPTMAAAANDVPGLLEYRPLAMEGMDARLIEVVRRARGAAAVPDMPDGGGWLLVELGGNDERSALALAQALVVDSSAISSRILPAGPEASRLWHLRADGAGLGGRTPSGNQAWPGWEDAAVPPEQLSSYLREFETLMSRYRVEGMIYGHFGDGCVHVRLDLPLADHAELLRPFVTEAAELVVAHGGSLSGEHGDGRARSELLGLMYSIEALKTMDRFKALFDPADLLNPGIVVNPAPLDAQLRRPRALPIRRAGGFSFSDDDGDFTKAVHRCVGVGKCRADASLSGGFMCPSYRASSDESDVTRGRARVLQEFSAGSFGQGNWAAAELNEVLDLCLSCKSCATDCPAGVDMARYKSEVLFRRYRGKLRPATHYILGWLPRWARLARLAPRAVNAVTRVPAVARAALWFSGMDTRRHVPAFAPIPFSKRRARLQAQLRARAADTPAAAKVVLWVDSFTGAFDPEAAEAVIAVLQNAGYQILIPEQDACCGLTWITTGQLGAARSRLRRVLDRFTPFAEVGIPIVGLEPSCTAVLRSDLLDLLPDDPRSQKIAAATRTVAEILMESAARTGTQWKPPDLSGVTAVVQPHCHQHSVTGFHADEELLRQSGATVTQLAGCCGLAGSFGMERGHYDMSVAVAEQNLLPALREAPEGAAYVADGFSCRTQAEQLASVSGITLAQLFTRRLAASDPDPSQELTT